MVRSPKSAKRKEYVGRFNHNSVTSTLPLTTRLVSFRQPRFRTVRTTLRRKQYSQFFSFNFDQRLSYSSQHLSQYKFEKTVSRKILRVKVTSEKLHQYITNRIICNMPTRRLFENFIKIKFQIKVNRRVFRLHGKL